MDEKTWGWVKVVGGAVALYLIWKSGGFMGDNINLAISIVAAITLIGGAIKVSDKHKKR